MDQKLSFKTSRQTGRFPLAAILLVCLSAMLVQPFLSAAPWQEDAADAKTPKEAPAKEPTTVPRISLGEITGSPGANLMVPLYYTPDPKAPLRSLSVDVDFVSSHLKFQKSARGVIPDDVAADINATIKDGEPDSKGISRSVLHVTVALTDKNSKKGLPEGLLAFLLFQVSMDAKPFTIKLTPLVVAAEDVQNPNKKMAKIAATPGTVAVEIPDLLPEATCFFFSH
jgi:hypothetical protein